MNNLLVTILGIFVLLSFPWPLRADYVMPYPSFMPGSKLYVVSGIVDSLEDHWSFGNIAKTKYHMSMSDKKLIEAKILFEYKQYYLAYRALAESDRHFSLTAKFLENARIQGKNITGLLSSRGDQSVAHVELLRQMIAITPENFLWQPERQQPIRLPIRDALNASVTIRKV